MSSESALRARSQKREDERPRGVRRPAPVVAPARERVRGHLPAPARRLPDVDLKPDPARVVREHARVLLACAAAVMMVRVIMRVLLLLLGSLIVDQGVNELLALPGLESERVHERPRAALLRVEAVCACARGVAHVRVGAPTGRDERAARCALRLCTARASGPLGEGERVVF